MWHKVNICFVFVCICEGVRACSRLIEVSISSLTLSSHFFMVSWKRESLGGRSGRKRSYWSHIYEVQGVWKTGIILLRPFHLLFSFYLFHRAHSMSSIVSRVPTLPMVLRKLVHSPFPPTVMPTLLKGGMKTRWKWRHIGRFIWQPAFFLSPPSALLLCRLHALSFFSFKPPNTDVEEAVARALLTHLLGLLPPPRRPFSSAYSFLFIQITHNLLFVSSSRLCSILFYFNPFYFCIHSTRFIFFNLIFTLYNLFL